MQELNLAPAVVFPIKEYPYEVTSDFITLKRTLKVKELEDTVRKYGGGKGFAIKVNNGTIAPREFQRPESWKNKHRKAFFISLLLDRVEGTLVLVDVETALRRILKTFPNDRSVHLFQSLVEAGYKWIIMDGNNRLKFLLSLINNEYKIPVGTYKYIVEGSETTVCKHNVRHGKQTFKDLPEKLQEAILTRSISSSEYYQVDWVNLKVIFQNCNAGCPPNPQELRNSGNGPWPEYVRQISDNVSDMLQFLFADPMSRLCGDDWIVDCLDFAIQAIQEIEVENEDGESDVEIQFSGIAQGTKNKLYNDGTTFLDYESQKFYLEKFDQLQQTFEEIKSDAKEYGFSDKMIKRRSTWQNLFWMMCHGILTYEQSVEALKLHEEAYKNKDRFKDPEGGDHDDLTFKNSCEGSRAINIEFRYEILNEIINKVQETHPDIPSLNGAFNLV